MQNSTTSDDDRLLQEVLIEPKPTLTIHSLMIVLCLMFIFALAFILGIDYFFHIFEITGNVARLPCFRHNHQLLYLLQLG